MHSRQTDSAVTIFAIVPNRLLFGMMLQCHLEIQNPHGNTVIFLSLACTYCLLSVIAQVPFNHEAAPGLSHGHLQVRVTDMERVRLRSAQLPSQELSGWMFMNMDGAWPKALQRSLG